MSGKKPRRQRRRSSSSFVPIWSAASLIWQWRAGTRPDLELQLHAVYLLYLLYLLYRLYRLYLLYLLYRRCSSSGRPAHR